MESLRATPGRLASPDARGFALAERSWVQLLCGFQLVTVDLLVVTALLFAIALRSSALPSPQAIATVIAGHFALWGIAWIATLAFTHRAAREWLVLGQWIAFLVNAALVWWGRGSLAP